MLNYFLSVYYRDLSSVFQSSSQCATYLRMNSLHLIMRPIISKRWPEKMKVSNHAKDNVKKDLLMMIFVQRLAYVGLLNIAEDSCLEFHDCAIF